MLSLPESLPPAPKAPAMHTESREQIARRLAASPAFDWLPGMLAVVPAASDGATGYVYRITEGTGPINAAAAFPDLSDGATRGALLDLVRAAYGDPTICPYRAADAWEVYCEAPEDSPIEAFGWPLSFDHAEEGPALALALILRPAMDAPPAEEG